jgi:hypothetical protein
VVVLICTGGCRREKLSPVAAVVPPWAEGDSNDFNTAFSEDGNTVYFTRTFDGNTTLMRSCRKGARWAKPQPLSFCDKRYSYADPAIASDGHLYFISNAPSSKNDTTRDYDIWRTRMVAGRWESPVNVAALNSAGDEYYISFTKNGDAYFSSSRHGGFGEEDIYYSLLGTSGFQTPVNVGGAVNTAHSEYDPFIDPDEEYMIFTSSGREDSVGKADLYWVDNKFEQWTKPVNIGKPVNSIHRDFCPFVTRQGMFYFSSDGDIKSIHARELREAVQKARSK